MILKQLDPEFALKGHGLVAHSASPRGLLPRSPCGSMPFSGHPDEETKRFICFVCVTLWRRAGLMSLMVSTLDSGSSGLDLSPDR